MTTIKPIKNTNKIECPHCHSAFIILIDREKDLFSCFECQLESVRNTQGMLVLFDGYNPNWGTN